MTDIINTYVPSPEELDPAQIAAVRETVTLWFSKDDPALDTRPGSVFGDLVVTPLSKMLTALSQGVENVQSDFLLENIANGTIYNCDFVAKYLRNFVPDDPEANRAYGIIRLVFSSDDNITLDSGVVFFSPNGDAFVPRVYNEGPLRVRKVGSISEEGYNDYVLHQTSQTRFFVDLPVMGDSLVQTKVNSAFSLSDEVVNLTSATAIVDFTATVAVEGLSAKAKRAASVYSAITFSTRSGMVRALKREFPELVNISPVLPGDTEMVRSSDNGYGVSVPCVDIFVKSNYYGSTFKQVYRLNYDADADAFFAQITTAHVPLKFTKALYTGDESIELQLTSYSRSTRTNSPKLSASFSDSNEYWVKVTMPRDGDGVPQLPIATDDTSGYQYFEVEYLTDPVYRSVKEFVTSEDNRPVNVDVNVRLCTPVIFDKLEINYKRKKGVTLNRSQASKEIFDTMFTTSYSEPYSDSKIVDSMFYAGASSVESIGGIAYINVGATDYYVNDGEWSDVETLETLAVEVPLMPVSSSDLFVTPFYDETTDPEENLKYAFGNRTSAFILDENNIQFTQV